MRLTIIDVSLIVLFYEIHLEGSVLNLYIPVWYERRPRAIHLLYPRVSAHDEHVLWIIKGDK